MRAKRRASERGAVFVEAIIVITFFIIAFTGVTFFHQLYVGKLRVTRLSRAATLHYAIIGCQGDIKNELTAVGGTSKTPGGLNGNDVSYGSSTNPSSSDAQSALNGQSGVSSLGAQIVHISADGDVSAHGGGHTYNAKLDSQSWVGCADQTTDKQYEDIIPKAISAISEL
jgi:hypothetical protein